MARLAGPADRYGAAFYVRVATYLLLAGHMLDGAATENRSCILLCQCSRDLVGVTTMLGLTAGLRCGLDVQGMLEGWGLGAALAGETAASLAAGCVQPSDYWLC